MYFVHQMLFLSEKTRRNVGYFHRKFMTDQGIVVRRKFISSKAKTIQSGNKSLLKSDHRFE